MRNPRFERDIGIRTVKELLPLNKASLEMLEFRLLTGLGNPNEIQEEINRRNAQFQDIFLKIKGVK